MDQNLFYFNYTSKQNFICSLYNRSSIFIGNNTDFFMTEHNFNYTVIDVIQSKNLIKYFALIVNDPQNKDDKYNVYNNCIVIIYRIKK